MTKRPKPLGRKAYGSIGHLPNSRLGPGDHSVHDGQARICVSRARDRHDRVIVTEKLDGSNVAVAKTAPMTIVALGRAGYLADTSPFEQHHMFAAWVRRHEERFARLLEVGERINGEWMAQAHGTRYRLHHSPFVAFDVMVEDQRKPWDEVVERCHQWDIVTPRVLSDGPPIPVDQVEPLIEHSGHGALDPVEGAVWRVEHRGAFDFMAKWVRPEKEDGVYLPAVSGAEPVWHWWPHPLAESPP